MRSKGGLRGRRGGPLLGCVRKRRPRPSQPPTHQRPSAPLKGWCTQQQCRAPQFRSGHSRGRTALQLPLAHHHACPCSAGRSRSARAPLSEREAGRPPRSAAMPPKNDKFSPKGIANSWKVRAERGARAACKREQRRQQCRRSLCCLPSRGPWCAGEGASEAQVLLRNVPEAVPRRKRVQVPYGDGVAPAADGALPGGPEQVRLAGARQASECAHSAAPPGRSASNGPLLTQQGTPVAAAPRLRSAGAPP